MSNAASGLGACCLVFLDAVWHIVPSSVRNSTFSDFLLTGIGNFAGIHAQLFATTLLSQLPKASEEQRVTLTPTVRALDLSFPQQMDAAVNQLLQHSKGDDKAAGQQVFELLQAALAGSAHAPLPAAGSTLALAVDVPSAEMRILVSPHCAFPAHTSLSAAQ